MLGHRRKKRDVALNVAEWNVRTLMDRSASQRPERQTALVAMEMDRYGIDVAALSETRLPGCNSLEDREPDKWTMRQMDRKPTGPQLNWTARQMHHKKNGQTDYWTGSVSSDFAVSNGVMMMMMMTMTTTMIKR